MPQIWDIEVMAKWYRSQDSYELAVDGGNFEDGGQRQFRRWRDGTTEEEEVKEEEAKGFGAVIVLYPVFFDIVAGLL
ncbi:hypothetical protein ACHAPT_012626 [Fusarium lateritium]